MKTGCVKKMIKTQSDVIWDFYSLKKITVQWSKIRAFFGYTNTMDTTDLVRFLHSFWETNDWK